MTKKVRKAFVFALMVGLAGYLVKNADPAHTAQTAVLTLPTLVHVEEVALPVEVQQRVIGGPIVGTLEAAMQEQGAEPELASKLSNVFQWQVDFFHVKKGGSFKVIYEQKLVDGAPIGVGKILGARITSEGKEFYAFYYKHPEGEGYYDERGNSLQQKFLKMPVPYGKITSEFSKRRFHPVLHRYKAHLGTDFAAPTGTEIYAVADGEVLEAKYQKGNGNYVKLSHGTTYATGYLHMSRIARGIQPGVKVKQGQVIGYVGSTGYATGPHVCFRFWKDGVQVDPQSAKMPAADPLPDTYYSGFVAVRDQYMPVLRERGPQQRQIYASLPDVSDLFGAQM